MSTPSAHLIVEPSLCLQSWKISSSCLKVVLTDSCSVGSCSFGVPFERGKPKVFILHNVGHLPNTVYFKHSK